MATNTIAESLLGEHFLIVSSSQRQNFQLNEFEAEEFHYAVVVSPTFNARFG